MLDRTPKGQPLGPNEPSNATDLPETELTPTFSHRVFIVDDDPDIIASLTLQLGVLGIDALGKPVSARSAQNLYSLIEPLPPNQNGADLYFVDLHLGGDYYVSGDVTGGAAVVEHIKQINPDAVIVVFSVEDMGNVKTSFQVNGLPYREEEGVHFLNKDSHQLEAVVRRALLNWRVSRLPSSEDSQATEVSASPPQASPEFDQQHTLVTQNLFAAFEGAWGLNDPENITRFYQAMAEAEAFLSAYPDNPNLVHEAESDVTNVWLGFTGLAKLVVASPYLPRDTQGAILTQAAAHLSVERLQNLAEIIVNHPDLDQDSKTIFYQTLVSDVKTNLEGFTGNDWQFERILAMTQLAVTNPHIPERPRNRFLEAIVPLADKALADESQAQEFAQAITTYSNLEKLISLIETGTLSKTSTFGFHLVRQLRQILEQARKSTGRQ